MKTADVGSSIFLIILGGFTLWQSEKISIGTPRSPGPGLFPFCLGLTLIGVGIIILVQGLKGRPNARETGLKRGRVVLALVAIFGYPFLLDPLGYLLSTFLLMFFLMMMMTKKKWWFAPAVATLISLGSYLLFKVWLQVLLPAGLLGF